MILCFSFEWAMSMDCYTFSVTQRFIGCDEITALFMITVKRTEKNLGESWVDRAPSVAKLRMLSPRRKKELRRLLQWRPSPGMIERNRRADHQTPHRQTFTLTAAWLANSHPRWRRLGKPGLCGSFRPMRSPAGRSPVVMEYDLPERRAVEFLPA